MIPYLVQLTLRLLAGVTDSDRKTLIPYFLAAQGDNGGFRGREGDGDLYYTGFALRGLFLLGAGEDENLLQTTTRFLESRPVEQLGAVELSSLIFSQLMLHWASKTEITQEKRTQFCRCWERFRRPDGCFATSDKSKYSSTYQTFLAATTLEMLGATEILQSIPVEPILARQRTDGGFVELEKLSRSGTNPTAAAVGFLKIREHRPNNQGAAIKYLVARQTKQGGFLANTLVPQADLLSSFTALVALADLDAEEHCNRNALRRFVAAAKLPDGAYLGAPWDRESDVEYTFYGLATELLLRCELPMERLPFYIKK